MSSIFKNGMTSAGLDLLVRAQMGKTITYTRVVLGDGFMPEGSGILDMTAVVNEVVSIENISLSRKGGNAVIHAELSYDMIPHDFYYRELGVYALDPDTGEELLYGYGNSENSAELIRTAEGSTLLERSLDVIVSVGNASDVRVIIDSSLNATVRQLEEMKAELSSRLDELGGGVEDANRALVALEEKHDSDIENMNALIDEVDKNIKELEDAAERSDQAHEEAAADLQSQINEIKMSQGTGFGSVDEALEAMRKTHSDDMTSVNEALDLLTSKHEEDAEALQNQIDEAKEQHTADVNALSGQIQEAANEMAAFEEEYAENASAVLERLDAIDEARRQDANALGERITALSNTHSSDMQSIETSIDVLKNNTGDKITFISFDQDTQAYTSSRSFTETGRLYLTNDQMPVDSYFDMTIIAHINGGVRSSDSSETASAVFGLKAYNDTSTLDSTTLVSEKTASLKSVHQESSYSHEGLGIDSGVVMMINAKNLTNSKSWTITAGHNVVSGGTAYTYSINIVVLIKKHSSVVSG